MTSRQCLYSAAIWVAASIAAGPVSAQQAAIAVESDNIGGVVRGPGGPEAGVWVIAETSDLPESYVVFQTNGGVGEAAGKHDR